MSTHLLVEPDMIALVKYLRLRYGDADLLSRDNRPWSVISIVVRRPPSSLRQADELRHDDSGIEQAE